MTSARDSLIIRRHCDWFARNGATPASVHHRRANLTRLADDLPVDLLDATFDHLDQWQSSLGKRRNQRRAGGLSANTIGTYTAHARSFFTWAVQDGHLEINPAERLPRPRRPRGQAHPIPEKDLMLALAVAPEPIRTWLILAAFMGLRAMEIAQLRRDSVDEVAGRLVLSGIGKGSKPFRLIVPRHVEPSLRLWMSTPGPLWSTPRGYPLTPLAVTRLVARWFDRQDMPYTLHWARHSFGTQVYAQTRDLLLTQDVMRHSSPNTTRIYVETSGAAETAAMDQLATRMLAGKKRRGRVDPGPGGSAAAAA